MNDVDELAEIMDEIKFKTSVDGDAIVRNLRKCYVRNGLERIVDDTTDERSSF